MRIALLAAVAATLVSANAVHAADLALTAVALRDKALTDRTAWDVTESLTTEVGARPQGSPAMDRARDWGVAKLKALGFENVHVETFETESWLRGAESAEVVAPFPQKLQILGLGRSAATPPGGLEAEIALFRSYDEMLAQPPGALKDKIAVVTEPMRRTQDIRGYAGAVRARSGGVEAARRGAVAYLVRSISTDDSRLPHGGGAAISGIPMAALSPPDAELLERMVARGNPVRIKLAMASTYRAKAPAYNVVGEIRGREKPEEVIVIGGHLDSWDAGTGAVDDAAGIGITTAAAKLIADLPQRPRRTVRVVMWGAEEQGGSGAAYAEANKAEVPNMIVAGESDLGAGEIFNAKLPAGSLEHPAMEAFAAAVNPLRVIISRDPARDGGADVAGLKRLGAPVVELQQDAGRYFDLHHSADDTLDKVDARELAQNVAVWAAFVYTVADSDIDFRKTASVSQ
ncbi:M20/M25/M40 family metallo-hydrolase [Phenylobacterium sp. NIBR 498073]|nr:M20/M25/M40 family metallo-hydrolase [Phenylobacterium sp. NIBR 498073]WGU41904.1 M20/M25/M40 family metallo-hydrolase [Phenylobacterium sp. NIBR 498073]